MPGSIATIAATLWETLTTASGTLALSFIVALALGLAVLTVLFLTSAVVVLDRFARSADRRGWVLGVGALWALAVGLEAALVLDRDALPPDAPYDQLRWLAAGVGAALVVITMAGMRLVLRRVRPARLAGVALAVLAVGYALLCSGIGNLYTALAPFAMVLVAGAILRRRRVRAGEPAGDAERWSWRLAAVLSLAVLATALWPDPRYEVAAAGVSLLGAAVGVILLGLLPLAVAGLFCLRHRVEWFIAARYLVAKRRQTFISIISMICVGGVAVGVWLIITVLSVMNGFERTWRDEVIGNRAHFTLQSHTGAISGYDAVLERVSGMPDVVAASPYVDAEGMVRGEGGAIVAIRLRGVDPGRIGAVTELRDDLVAGDLEALAARSMDENGGPPVPGIVIGHQLAVNLGFRVGDPILVISPFGGPQTPLGPAPRLKRFRVAGIFKSNFFQYDEVFTYVDLAAAQDFRRTDDVVDGILVRVEDFYRSQAVGNATAAALGFPYYAIDWKQFFPSFFQALKTERVTMFILLTMIIVVAAFMIVATLIMMIMEKSSDIAILKTMGAEDATIERIFAIEGTLIGLVGTGLGVIAGVVVTTQLSWIQGWVEALFGIDTLPENVYPLSHFPWEFDAVQMTVVITLAMVLSLGATLLPSRQGARLDPAEALRYE